MVPDSLLRIRDLSTLAAFFNVLPEVITVCSCLFAEGICFAVLAHGETLLKQSTGSSEGWIARLKEVQSDRKSPLRYAWFDGQ